MIYKTDVLPVASPPGHQHLLSAAYKPVFISPPMLRHILSTWS